MPPVRSALAAAAEGVATTSGARHGEQAVDDGVFVVAATRDDLHRDRVEAAIAHEARIDVQADHLAEDEGAGNRLPFHPSELYNLRHLALERAGRARHARR